jgi:hypothetical protein
MVIRRWAVWVAVAFLFSLCACANFWKFQSLQDDLGADAGLDATTGVSPGGDGGSAPDGGGGPDAVACTMCGGQCVDLTSSLQNCGGCNKRCLASQICQAGACACTDNQTLCGAAGCVDMMTDHANCGSCGNTCAAGTACQGGKCVCPGMEMQCGSANSAACVYPSSDHGNCGGCGNTCAVGGSCQGGACVCPTGQQTCNVAGAPTCVDTTSDHNNCGGCGAACPSAETCSNSVCVPCASIGPSGLMCGTPLTCVNTATDHANCGGCGNPCLATQICQGGACICPGTEALCGSGGAQGCVTLSSDQNNCGKCGVPCTGGMVCANSVCACPTGFHNCGGTCVPDTSTSTSSCGTTCGLCPAPVGGTASCAGMPLGCGQACANPALPTLCNKGANATCVNTTNDTGNCGGCGLACSTNRATESCTGSKCAITACTAGFADCDHNPANGCEIDTNTNVANCGGCGLPCNMTGGVEGCVNGKCTNPVCNAPMADCDHNPADGCEIDTATDRNHCGNCTTVCPTGSNCSGGVCSNCPAGTMLCNGACAACPAQPVNGTLTCSGMTCIQTCTTSFPKLCGSGASAVCVNTLNDNTNCGACGAPCSLATQPNKCEQNYACQAGVCTGSNPVTCPVAPDTCHTAGTCVSTTGVCSAPTPLTGNACTGPNLCDTYTCQNGSCTGVTSVTCTGSVCNAPGTCQSGTGTCTAPTPLTGPSCTGSNLCDTYSCQNGTCTGVPSVACPPSDGCHLAGTCNSTTGLCSNPNVPDSPPTACNGTNMCLMYACVGGVCTGSSPGSCSAMDQCHVAGTCSPATGMCSNPAVPDSPPTACNDNNPCTTGDVCTGGLCGGTPVSCMPLDQCHAAGTCLPSGMCTNPTVMDGNSCTGAAPGMTCQGGVCQCPPATPMLCTDGSGNSTCVDLTSDPNNCGGCNMACASPDAGEPPECVTSVCQ